MEILGKTSKKMIEQARIHTLKLCFVSVIDISMI